MADLHRYIVLKIRIARNESYHVLPCLIVAKAP
jgi:hypothetical protein